MRWKLFSSLIERDGRFGWFWSHEISLARAANYWLTDSLGPGRVEGLIGVGINTSGAHGYHGV